MTPTPPNRPRKAPGQKAGGQFTSKAHGEAEVGLDASGAAGAPGLEDARGGAAGRQAAPERSYEDIATDLDAVVAARSPEELEQWVNHADPDVRSEAAVNPYLSYEQALRLVRDPDVIVRWQVTRTGTAGLAEIAATDDDPLVRLEALYAWDLPPDARDALIVDPMIVRTRQALGSAPV